MRGLLGTATVVTSATGFAVLYPLVAALVMFAIMNIMGHAFQPSLKRFPRTTLLCFTGVGIAYIAGGFYSSLRTGDFDQSFVGRLIFGSLSLLLAGVGYVMIKRREV